MTRDYYLEGYIHGPPSDEAARIDAEIAAGVICPLCDIHCEYDAWHKEGSYVALAVCPMCDWETEF